MRKLKIHIEYNDIAAVVILIGGCGAAAILWAIAYKIATI